MKEDFLKEMASKMKEFEKMGLNPLGKKEEKGESQSARGSDAEEEKPQILLECHLNYSLIDEKGVEVANKKAQARLDEENLLISPEFGEALLFSYRDILEVCEGDYKVNLMLGLKEKLILSGLGYHYEDFVRVLCKLRSELLLKDMLVKEKVIKSGVKAEFIFVSPDRSEKQKGICEPRLYETALAIIPDKAEPLRFPYCDILDISEGDYSVIITIETQEKIILSKMGKELDPFKKSLSDAMNEISLKTQMFLKELVPMVNPSALRKVASLMRDGKAARKSDIDSILPELWQRLEKKLEAAGFKEEYDFLKSLSVKEKLCIGFKKGLMGGTASEYIWFLIPLYSTDSSQPGNAVAIEAASEDESGKATYFFRMVERKDYPNFKNIDDLHREADNFIKMINRCMLTINFRREPIYLSDEKLEETQCSKYKFAIKKIPELQTLRNLFIGRIIHSTDEQWKKDALDLLKFNVGTTDDNEKWKKGG